MNNLKLHIRQSIEGLLDDGIGQREISRRLGVDCKTIRRIARLRGSKSLTPSTGFCSGSDQNVPGRPPAAVVASTSACAPYQEWIEAQVRLGRNAMSMYQDLVDNHGFAHKYVSVRRFVASLKIREPDRFDVLEFAPGEEAQVDYGQGAPTLTEGGKYKRPYLFVMTLKYSGKSFRKVTFKTSQEIWARLHEEAFRFFGGCPQYVVSDNLKEGVIKPDIYEPELNPVYAAMLRHYGVTADPCRVRDPNRKGTVENAIQHTQSTALKGRKFESIEAQNAHLQHWEEHWAATRIHGRKKRQVMVMYLEEKPYLKPLPAVGFSFFRQEVRKVDDSGLIQVDGCYYSALPSALYQSVFVRIYATAIEIFDRDGVLLRRHEKSVRKGSFTMEEGDRLFNPSRQTAYLLKKIEQIGPHAAKLARAIFANLGRPGAKAIYGLSNLTRTYQAQEIDAVCADLSARGCYSFAAVKKTLERRSFSRSSASNSLRQTGPHIRPLSEYQAHWEAFTHQSEETP